MHNTFVYDLLVYLIGQYRLDDLLNNSISSFEDLI